LCFYCSGRRPFVLALISRDLRSADIFVKATYGICPFRLGLTLPKVTARLTVAVCASSSATSSGNLKCNGKWLPGPWLYGNWTMVLFATF